MEIRIISADLIICETRTGKRYEVGVMADGTMEMKIMEDP